MYLNGITIPALLWLTTLNHVSAIAPPNKIARKSIQHNEPLPNLLLPRQQPIPVTTITTIPPLSTSHTSHTTTTSSTTTTTTRVPTNHNHNIAVSPPNATNTTQHPTFHPATLRNIPIGDTLTFYFYPSNYSIVQSAFQTPCQPISVTGGGTAGTPGWFSGWHPTGSEGGIARSKFVVTVTGTEPVWIYGVDGAALAAGSMGKSACEYGLVMVVNPLAKSAAGGLTLGRYRDRAAALRMTGSAANSDAQKAKDEEVGRNVSRVPDAIWGGEVTGVSDKEKVRWEGRHPEFSLTGNGTVAGKSGNTTTTATDGEDGGDGGDGGDGEGDAKEKGSDVQGFKNGVDRLKVAAWKKGSGWVGILVILGVGVCGLGV